MDCSFSFGHNRSYFLRIMGADYAYSDGASPVPTELVRVVTDPEHPQANAHMFDVALAMEPGVWCMNWETATKGRFLYYQCLGNNYARLVRFMRRTCGAAGGRLTRTTFGPNHSYFSIAPGGISWQNIPSMLEEDVTACIHSRHPTAVALGINDSYLVVYSDGSLTYDLRGEYPQLEELMKEASEMGGLKYVALNPFVAGEYYAVCGRGYRWNLPSSWAKDVADVTKKLAYGLTAAGGDVVSVGGTLFAPTPPTQLQLQVRPAIVQQPAVAQPPAYQYQQPVTQPKSGGIDWGKIAEELTVEFVKEIAHEMLQGNGGGR